VYLPVERIAFCRGDRSAAMRVSNPPDADYPAWGDEHPVPARECGQGGA